MGVVDTFLVRFIGRLRAAFKFLAKKEQVAGVTYIKVLDATARIRCSCCHVRSSKADLFSRRAGIAESGTHGWEV